MAWVLFMGMLLIMSIVYFRITVILRRRKSRMLPDLLRNFPRIHSYATKVLRKHGGTFEFRIPTLFNMDFVITCDPLNVQHILSTNFANYPKGPEFREMFNVLGDGILSSDSDLWRLQRRMFHLWNRRQSKFEVVSRTIQQKVVDGLIPFLDRVSESGSQIDLQDVLQKMITFDNAISLIFDLDVGSSGFKLSREEYQKGFGDIQETLMNRHFVPRTMWKLQRWLQIGGERKHKKAWKIVDEFMHECMSLKRAERIRDSYVDMISVYLEEKEGQYYSDKFLKDVALNFVLASRDTLTSSLTWFFWLISTHPSVEAKILKEMEENLPAKDDDTHGFFTAETLSKLVYLQASVYETLRLYPPVPFNHKTALETDVLPTGHCVRANNRVLISFYAMGRMEEIWGEDCLEFRPERWIDPEGRLAPVPANKFPVFNAGPRTCLGKDMALIQTKVVAINVLRKYRIRVVEGHPISPTLTITLHMKHGLKIHVSKRSDLSSPNEWRD